MHARRKKKKYNPLLLGYGTYVSDEAVRMWKKVPILNRFEWIEEMIQLEALLPRRVRALHRALLRGAR